MATVERGPLSASSSSPSMRLTVKTSSSKLREATRATSTSNTVAVNSRDAFVGGEIIEGKRPRNVRKSYVVQEESDSEEDEEDQEMEDESEEDEDAEGEDEDDDMDADGDVDMEVAPPPPVIKISKAQSGKQSIVIKPPTKVDTKTVEQKEVEEEGSDDDELSELDSDLGEEVEDEEAMQTGNEEDAEGEDEEMEEEDDDENPFGSDEETPAGGSRASTPDLAKLTVRQRARLEEGGSGHLMALPDGMQKFGQSVGNC